MMRALLVAALLRPGGALVHSPATPRVALGSRASRMHIAAPPAETDEHSHGLLNGFVRLKAQHDSMWKAFRRHTVESRASKHAWARDYAEGAQITMVGAITNLLLATGKALAGWFGHSSAMMCDAAHSFSDLLSDGLTLVALRMGSLPPDSDHPYGHGRFETIGCLAIGWLLLLTAASFGSSAVSAVRGAAVGTLAGPRRLALWAAIASVVSKEVLFRATVRVGEKLGSDVIMANAWHHRSDALSSVVAIVGIAGALLGWRVLDPLCGVAVAGLVAWMGGQILCDALLRLSDTADPEATQQISAIARGVDGVLGVQGARCRWMSSSAAMADLCVMVGPMTTASAAQRVGTQVRAAVMAEMPDLSEVLVRTQTMCPLLDATSAAPPPLPMKVEARVESVLRQLPAVASVPMVSVRYVNNGEMAVDVGLEIARDCEGMTVLETRRLAEEARRMLLAEVEGLNLERHVSISARL
eukprot:Transcript_23727.p1 GENE.Transcript_23727~~Transcript_23727.p1  ORF type:complete len:485 (-),score=132.10 Transcript_23727:215-1627(-)